MNTNVLIFDEISFHSNALDYGSNVFFFIILSIYLLFSLLSISFVCHAWNMKQLQFFNLLFIIKKRIGQ